MALGYLWRQELDKRLLGRLSRLRILAKPRKSFHVTAHRHSLVPLFIGGKPVIHDQLQFPVLSPWTNTEAYKAQGASVEDAIAAAISCKEAFKSWRNVSPQERRHILLRAADILNDKRERLVDLHYQEIAMPKPLAAFFVGFTVEMIRELASLTTSTEGTIALSNHKNAFVYKEPLGSVLSISPWNCPSVLAVRSAVSPIAAGNVVLHKISDIGSRIQHETLNCLHEAGLPAGVLNLIQTRPQESPEVLDALIAHGSIRKIAFTGSVKLGRIVAEKAGRHLKPVLLELGGKSAVVIDESADLEQAAQSVLQGAWINSGQICMSTERVYVLKSVYEKFLQTVIATAKNAPDFISDFYPKISESSANFVQGLVDDAVGKGARVLVGDHTKLDGGYIGRTLLTNVTPEMAIYKEESFGPTAFIESVDSLKLAIDRVNDSEYGLNAAVWAADITKAIAIAKEIECGSVHINGDTIYDESTIPHGGTKSSGYGRFGAKWGLNEFLQSKTITIPKVSIN